MNIRDNTEQPVRNAEIVSRKKAGQWPRQIAAEMKISRNAVIGVINRAGLAVPVAELDRSSVCLRGNDHVIAKLDEEKVRDIRKNCRPGVSGQGLRDFAAKYGVNPKTIGSVYHRKTWAHVK